MTAAELERKLTNILYEAELTEVVEALGDICGELGDDDAQKYLWNCAAWLKLNSSAQVSSKKTRTK